MALLETLVNLENIAIFLKISIELYLPKKKKIILNYIKDNHFCQILVIENNCNLLYNDAEFNWLLNDNEKQ